NRRMAAGQRSPAGDRRAPWREARALEERGCPRGPGRGCRHAPANAGRTLRTLPWRTGGRPMKNVVIVAGKEIQEGLRNRWVLATTLLLAALALTLTFLGSAPIGQVGAGALDVVVVSLSSLTIFLVPLIALLLSHDAIVGEIERGTMLLLLSYPIGRWQ